MPRTPRKSVDRWPSAVYAHGYCKPGRGKEPSVMLFYKDREARSEPCLRWCPENREGGIQQLDEWIKAGQPARAARAPQHQVVPPIGEHTVFTLLKIFRATKYPDMTKSARLNYEQAINHYLYIDLDLDVPTIISHLNHVELHGSILTKEDKAHHRTGFVTRGTRSRYLSCLQTIFELGVRLRQIDSNPITLKGIPAMKRRTDNPVVTPEEFARFITDIETHKSRTYALYYRLLYLTGMRRSEATALRVGDIDLAGDELTITGKGSRTSQGARIRTVPIRIVPGLYELLAEAITLASPSGRQSTGRLFRFTPDWAGKVFNEAKDRVGILDRRTRTGEVLEITLHTLRGSAEDVMENEWGWSDPEIEDYTGHTDRVRKNRYRANQSAAKIARRIERRQSDIHAQNVHSIGASQDGFQSTGGETEPGSTAVDPGNSVISEQ